jgi:GON domain-containing protein
MSIQHFACVSILIAACGQVAHDPAPETDAAPASDASPAADAPPAVVIDRNCTEVKARLGTAADGVHMIDPDREGVKYKPFAVFCAGMATPTPKEYLELVHKSAPADMATSNFSTYAMGVPHAAWTCNCGVATTLFSKIRIDPTTLIVDVDDRTYTVFANSTQVQCLNTMPGCPGVVPFAVAEACVTNFDASGRANIDLRDMPFHVAGTDTAMFAGGGFTPAGSAMLDSDRKVGNLTGGGDCGWFGAASGLQLAQDL